MEDSKKMTFSHNTWWLSVMSFLNDVSSEMIQPVLPFFLIGALSLSKGDVGLIEGLAAGVTSFFLWYSGVWSDRIHARKKIVVFGYALSAFTKPLFGIVASGAQATVLRVLDRSGKGLRDTPRDALISESTDRAHRGGSFGLNRAFDMLGRVVGSLFVLYILSILPVAASTYRFIFKISFFPAIIGVVLLVLFVRDATVARPAGEKPRLFEWHKVDKHTRFFFVISAVFTLANTSYAFFLLRASGVGIPVRFAPLMYLVFSLSAALLSIPIGRWTDARGRARSLLLGYLLFAGVCFAFVAVVSPALVWLLLGLYGVTMALTDGVGRALVADLIHRDVRATALGVYHGLNGAAAFAASFLFGALWDVSGFEAAFVAAGAVSLCAALLLVGYMYRHRGHGHFGEPVKKA